MSIGVDDIVSQCVPKPRSARALDGTWQPTREVWAWAGMHDEPRACASIHIDVHGASCGSSAARGQQCEIVLKDDCMSIIAACPAGVRRARGIVRQLLHIAHVHGLRSLPAMRIDDEPMIATRGVMLDVSRCRIPTMRELFEVINTLESFGCNHLQLYVEHTFASIGHDAAWRGWSAITPEELVAIDQRCASRGIELATNQNCLGHLTHWLRLPEYAHLAETHGEWMFDVWPRSGPFSLCPTDPASTRFVDDILTQQMACVRGPLVNIGCDEAYDIVYGRSAAAVADRGRASVYFEHVRGVCDIVARTGKRPMLWGDIALSEPASLELWPRGAIALAWGYEPDVPFDAWCRLLHEREIEAWICPGTSSWCGYLGRTSERVGNLNAAIDAARSNGIDAMMLTDWGDHGHWQVWPVALLGIVEGLAAMWEGRVRGEEVDRALSLHAYSQSPHASVGIATWLRRAGDIDLQLRRVGLSLAREQADGALRNQAAMFADLRLAWDLLPRTMASPSPWQDALERLEAHARVLPGGLSALLRDECEHAVACARFALARGIERRLHPEACPTDSVETLGNQGHSLLIEHSRLWRVRSRSGGLTQSMEIVSRAINEIASMRQQPLIQEGP